MIQHTFERHPALQRIFVELAGFLRGIFAEYFNVIVDFKRVFDKLKVSLCILCAAKFAFSPANHILCQFFHRNIVSIAYFRKYSAVIV